VRLPAASHKVQSQVKSQVNSPVASSLQAGQSLSSCNQRQHTPELQAHMRACGRRSWLREGTHSRTTMH